MRKMANKMEFKYRWPPSEVSNVREAEQHRFENIKEATKLISQIQNAGLTMETVRLMNKQINRELWKKGAWEDRIKELGGRDHKAEALRGKRDSVKGEEAPRWLGGVRVSLGAEIHKAGFKYFGVAKDLPEAIEEQKQKEAASKEGELPVSKFLQRDPMWKKQPDDELTKRLREFDDSMSVEYDPLPEEPCQSLGDQALELRKQFLNSGDLSIYSSHSPILAEQQGEPHRNYVGSCISGPIVLASAAFAIVSLKQLRSFQKHAQELLDPLMHIGGLHDTS